MNYKMKVVLSITNAPKGFQNEKVFKMECSFFYDKEQFGNGYFLTIESENFETKYFDLRYDCSFKKSEKEKWLKDWAKNYWNGKNGAWTVKTLEIIKL